MMKLTIDNLKHKDVIKTINSEYLFMESVNKQCLNCDTSIEADSVSSFCEACNMQLAVMRSTTRTNDHELTPEQVAEIYDYEVYDGSGGVKRWENCNNCKGTGYIEKQELEPVWTLDNPVLDCMHDAFCDISDEDNIVKQSVEVLQGAIQTEHRKMYILATMHGLKEALKDKILPSYSVKSFTVIYDQGHGYWRIEPLIGIDLGLPVFSKENAEKVVEYMNAKFPNGWEA